MATATLDSTNAAGASLRVSCACVATAAIAQLGERQTEDLKVPGSIPGLGILAHSNVTCCASAPAMNATNHARTPRARCRPRARPGAAVHVRVCVVEWHDSRFWSGRSWVQIPKQPLRQHRRTDDANHGLAQDTLAEWSEGVDSSSTSASCVGSNPTGVTRHTKVYKHGPRLRRQRHWPTPVCSNHCCRHTERVAAPTVGLEPTTTRLRALRSTG